MRPDLRALLRLSTLFYALVGLAAWVWAWLWGDLDRLFGERAADLTGVALGVGLGLAVVIASALAHRFSRHVRAASHMLSTFFGPIGVGPALYLALLSGFFEELAFRGALWPQLGLAGTTIFFGVVHAVPVRVLAFYPLFAAGVGLLLGLLRARTGSVWPPIAAHVTVNAINLALLGLAERRRLDSIAPPSPDDGQPDLPPVLDRNPIMDTPEFDPVDESFPRTIWRYDLRVELAGTDRQSLPECLEHEQLALFQYVPREQVYEELAQGKFVFTATLAGPFAGFPHDVSTISVYLFQNITGIEVAERYVDEKTTDDVRAWKVVAQRGEWVKVPLLVESPEEGRFLVDPDREDTEVIASHWDTYPRWFQDGMRYRYPHLR